MPRIITVLITLCIFFQTQAQFCDPELQAQNGDPNAYQERDPNGEINRCEGIYLQDVASSAITLTSFTTTYEDFSGGYPDTVFLTWIMPDEYLAKPIDKVHIRADSQVFKLYYRLDTVQPLDTNSFEWNTKVIKNLQLTNDEIGVSAWMSAEMIGGVARDIYLPLSVLMSEDNHLNSTYSIVVMPSSELTAVKYRIYPTSNGYVSDSESLVEETITGDYFPSGKKIAFNFNLDLEESIYYLEIEVTRKNSKKSHLEIWFYHENQNE